MRGFCQQWPQNRSPVEDSIGWRCWLGKRDAITKPRQIHAEGRSLTDLAIGDNVPSILLHDSVDRGQPEARSFARFLASKKGPRIRGMASLLIPQPVSLNTQHGIVARLNEGVLTGKSVVRFYVARFKRRPAAVRHRSRNPVSASACIWTGDADSGTTEV